MGALQDNIDVLKVDVTTLTSVDESAIALLNGLSTQLAAAIQAAIDAGATQAQLQSLADFHSTLTTQTSALADAVAANTAP